MSRAIKSLKIMLPYLNDEYVVGNEIDFINQASHGDNTKKAREYGKIKSINDYYLEMEAGCDLFYSIEFENGKSIEFENVPVQIGY